MKLQVGAILLNALQLGVIHYHHESTPGSGILAYKKRFRTLESSSSFNITYNKIQQV